MNTGLKYAKRNKVLSGRKKLTALSIDFKDTKPVSLNDCASMVRQVAQFYKECSRGLLLFEPAAFNVPVNLNEAKQNVAKAEKIAMAKHKSDIYCVINGFDGRNHAGKNIAHLKGTLLTTACHEVGHLLGLGHSGSFGRGDDLDHTGDGLSVMSRFGSHALTAPQYYHLGWLFENEVALHDPENGVKEYSLRKITDYDNKDKLLAAVMVPFKGRDAFISSTSFNGNRNVSLHISNGGASQKIAMFSKDFLDSQFTGLYINVLELGDGVTKISVEQKIKNGLNESVFEDSFKLGTDSDDDGDEGELSTTQE